MKHQHPRQHPTVPVPRPVAPAPSDSDSSPTFDELAADPEIAALLDFEPVPRKTRRTDGWTDELQRMFIAWLAHYGSPGLACDELLKARGGVDKLLKSPGSDSFRATWAGAIAIAERLRAARLAAGYVAIARHGNPRIDHRRRPATGHDRPPAPGQICNEAGDWEDEGSFNRRGEDAADSIASKLLRIRRLYLSEIAAKEERVCGQERDDW